MDEQTANALIDEFLAKNKRPSLFGFYPSWIKTDPPAPKALVKRHLDDLVRQGRLRVAQYVYHCPRCDQQYDVKGDDPNPRQPDYCLSCGMDLDEAEIEPEILYGFAPES